MQTSLTVEDLIKKYAQTTEKSLERKPIQLSKELPSEGQPPAKISAVPGKSGSSGVFRVDTGRGPIGDLDQERDGLREEDDRIAGVIYNPEMKNPIITEEWMNRISNQLQGPRSPTSKKLVKSKAVSPNDFRLEKGEEFPVTNNSTSPKLEKRLKVLGTERMVK